MAEREARAVRGFALQPVEDRALDHMAVELRPQGGIDGVLEEQRQRHEVDADRPHRPRVVAPWVLGGVRVDDDLMKPHASRVGVLSAEQLAETLPAGGGRGHVRVWLGDHGRELDPAARADLETCRRVVEAHAPPSPRRRWIASSSAMSARSFGRPAARFMAMSAGMDATRATTPPKSTRTDVLRSDA